jgi:hypothetical protein
MVRAYGERDIDLARRMQAVGVPLELDEFKERLIVHQAREPFVDSIAASYLTRSHIGLTIQIYITIISNSGVPLTLCGLQVGLPWTSTPVELLQDPADPFAPEIYRFPGQTSGGIDKSAVIVQSGKKLTRGRSVEGFLLGCHFDPIPLSFRHGTKVPVVLTIEDQFGEFHSRELFLAVDRTAEQGPKPKPPQPRRSLFDKPDSLKREAQHKGNAVEATTSSYVKNRT